MGIDAVAEVLRQFAFLGAVLAGFAVTFLVGLFNAPAKRRSVDWTVITALIAAACLIACTVAGVTGVIYIMDRPALHAPGDIPLAARETVRSAARWAGIGFLLGMGALLVSLGFSGWIRSRKIGIFSSVLAVLTLLLLLYFLHRVIGLT